MLLFFFSWLFIFSLLFFSIAGPVERMKENALKRQFEKLPTLTNTTTHRKPFAVFLLAYLKPLSN